MSLNNIPPPPQYPNLGNEINDQIIKDNSIMENSVVYISDNSSLNYKPTSKNEYYQPNLNQILPNLVNSLNSTYQNLPPKSPKSNYRHIDNQNVYQMSKFNQQPFQFNATSANSASNQIDYSKPHPNPSYNPKNSSIQNNQWYLKNKDELERNKPNFTPTKSIQKTPGSKTRSHPNLINDYVNLSGADHLLSEIMGGLHRKTQNVYNKTQPNNQMIRAPNSTSNVLYTHYTPEMFRANPNNHQINNNANVGHTYPLAFSTVSNKSPKITTSTSSANISDPLSNNNTNNASYLPECFNKDSENFNSESSRLVNLLLEENKRLRSKLRQSDTKVEVIDQLERKVHNLEVLFEELLTSQRRQRLLDLQLQQASLSNYISRNVISNQDILNSSSNAAKTVINTPVFTSNTAETTSNPVISSDTNNLISDDAAISSEPLSFNNSHNINFHNLIPSSPVVSAKMTMTAESPGDNSLCLSSANTQKKVSQNFDDSSVDTTAVANRESFPADPGYKSTSIVLDACFVGNNNNVSAINSVVNQLNASETRIIAANDGNRDVTMTDRMNNGNYPDNDRLPNYRGSTNLMNQQLSPISSPMMIFGQSNQLPIKQNPASLPASPIFYPHNSYPYMLTHLNNRNHYYNISPALNSTTGVVSPTTNYKHMQ